MPELINWDLIRNPYNWAITVLMVFFGLFLLALVSPEISKSDAES